MVTETKHYRQIVKITDETFDVQQLGNYNLYITVGKHAIRVGVADAVRNKFIALEDYELRSVFTPLQVAHQFQEIAQKHPFLGKPDWKQIRVAEKNQKFTLIPDSLFDAKAAEEYLRLNCDFDYHQERVYTYKHKSLEAINIFATDKYLAGIISEQYPQRPIRHLHQTSTFIESLLHFGERNNQRKTYVFTEKNNLTILVVRGGTLEFCNLFHYATPEDFMYFLVFVMQEQKLNPDADALTVWGEITHDSALFTLMRKYIRHVHFGSRPIGVNYSYKIEEQFEHRFLDVYSMHFCE